MKLTHDVPQSKGAENALKRAQQMVCASYTPIKRLPILQKLFDDDGTPWFERTYSMPGFPVKGIMYSSVRRVEKFVGYNVSLETFFTALANPNSVVYKKTIVQKPRGGVHCYYGAVCSVFASYVLQLPYKMRCTKLQEEPSLKKLNTTDPDALRLVDVLLDSKHVAIVTGIERDENGKVQYISVSESCMPYCRETRFSREGFVSYWMDDPLHAYEFYRYEDLDQITYTPSPFVPLEGESAEDAKINRTLMPDFGNKANYILGHEPVELSVFDASYDTVAVTDPDGKTQLFPVVDGKVVLTPEKVGFYTACCVRGEEKSDAVEWCMTELSFTMDRSVTKPGETLTVRYQNAADDPLVAWHYIRCEKDGWLESGYFTDKGSAGVITIPTTEAEGDCVLFLLARNAYGIYSSVRIPFQSEA